MANRKHVHKYRLVEFGINDKVWACGLPDCSHYLPRHLAKMIEGRASECWDCESHTIMSVDRMKFAIANNDSKILCQDCMDKRRGIFVEKEDLDIDSIIADMKQMNKR